MALLWPSRHLSANYSYPEIFLPLASYCEYRFDWRKQPQTRRSVERVIAYYAYYLLVAEVKQVLEFGLIIFFHISSIEVEENNLKNGFSNFLTMLQGDPILPTLGNFTFLGCSFI